MPPNAARQYLQGGVGLGCAKYIKGTKMYLAYCPEGRSLAPLTNPSVKLLNHKQIHYTFGGRKFLLQNVLLDHLEAQRAF
jgi:hypothetical protein